MKLSINPIYSLALILCLACFSCAKKTTTVVQKPKKKEHIRFYQNHHHSLMEIVSKAERNDKLIFLYFGADWCLPCKILEEEVYSLKAVHQFYNSNFVNYKVDVDKGNGANLKLMFGAEELPTLLVLNQKGQLLEKFNGPSTQKGLLEFGKRMLAIKP